MSEHTEEQEGEKILRMLKKKQNEAQEPMLSSSSAGFAYPDVIGCKLLKVGALCIKGE